MQGNNKGMVYFGCTLEFMTGCAQARCWPLLLVCWRSYQRTRHWRYPARSLHVGNFSWEKSLPERPPTPRFQLPVGFGYSSADWCTWNFVQQFTTHRVCSFNAVIHDACRCTFQSSQENGKLDTLSICDHDGNRANDPRRHTLCLPTINSR